MPFRSRWGKDGSIQTLRPNGRIYKLPTQIHRFCQLRRSLFGQLDDPTGDPIAWFFEKMEIM